MPKRKKRGVQKKKKDDSPDDTSECDSLDRPLSAKKVAAASSTSQLEDDLDQISSFTSVSLLNSSRSESEVTAVSSHFLCNYCDFSAGSTSVLISHMRQHMIKCPHCTFSSLSRIEVNRHCKHEHAEDPEGVSQEVDSSSVDWEMDKDPCSACVFCSFMTYSTEHLEKHTSHKHPGMLAKSVARMITKQSSAEVRRDDALFYLSLSNDGLSKSSSFSSNTSEKPASPIVIDGPVNKADDVKPDVKFTSSAKSFLLGSEPTGQLLEQARSDKNSGDNVKSTPAKTETSSAMSMLVKVETMYCLTCPYSNVYIEKLKCHTIAQHPVGAAATTYSCSGGCVEPEDITFFCVREDCSHASSDCVSYQKHLMNCCSCQKTLTVLERERLKSTITYILEHQRKFKLPAVDGFFDFGSSFLDVCLPPTLTGISSSVATEAQFIQQTRIDRLHNIPQNPVTDRSSIESLPVPTGLYKAPSYLSATLEGPSACPVTEVHSSNGNRAFCPQQLPNVAQNIPAATVSSGDYQSPLLQHPVVLPCHVDTFSRNLPADGRSVQAVQNSSMTYYSQNQGSNYQLPAPANSLTASYPDTPQTTVNNWPGDQVQPAGLVSGPVQPEQSYNNVLPTQNIEMNTGLRAQNNTLNSLTQRTESLSVGQNVEINQNFMPAASHNSYASNPSQISQSAVNVSRLQINTSSSFPGAPSEASVSISNNMTTTDSRMLPNSVTGNVFYGQQNPVSNILNTAAHMDQAPVEAQPLPKMVDLLSDSYSILLSDEFGPDGQMQQGSDDNFIQTQQVAACQSLYPPETAASTQSQTVSHSSIVQPQGQATSYQPMQHDGSRYQQVSSNNSQMSNCGSQVAFATTSHNNQVANLGSSFQAVPSTNNYGSVQNTLSRNSSIEQTVPFQPSEVPNFLVSSETPVVSSSHIVAGQPLSTTSLSNRHPSAAPPAAAVAGQAGSFTPPKNTNTANKFASASPLSPSIYLSGQVQRHKRSNWTAADMSPRGMMLPGVLPRHVQPPAPSAGAHGYMNPRMAVPGRRGYPRGPRMSSGRGRMPTPRMPINQFGGDGGGDDDDVILTAVIRGAPPVNQQTRQQPGNRFAYRGVAQPTPRGRGLVLPGQNRHRGQGAGPRMAYSAAPPLHIHKQFDISKHFEDLACVVNASAEDGDDRGDDIQIVGVTPGKGKDKGNQPKAVDASKFSFCCVHCGKDQGSKMVMKQHMKARHNDSLLGAFTNTETGQLLFFCPQLACEFMTYDEKRLSEHLSKCYDLDKTKPFDFGTAIKNLKSLKIRQLDVRTMGRSQENPIDLDGQGMKDNFSSSLNDAFGDIVVNASGRHMLRNVAPPQTRFPRPQLQTLPAPTGVVMQGKTPPRSLPPSITAIRPGHPRFPQHTNMDNRMHRSRLPSQQPRQQSCEMRPTFRHAGPPRMDARSIRNVRPRAPGTAAHRQPVPLRSPVTANVATPRLPSRGQQEDVVIVIDVDSPERPDEVPQNETMAIESPDIVSRMPSHSSNQASSSEGLPETLLQPNVHYSEIAHTNSFQEHHPTSDNPVLLSRHAVSGSPDFNPGSSLLDDSSGSHTGVYPTQLSCDMNQSVSYSHGGTHLDDMNQSVSYSHGGTHLDDMAPDDMSPDDMAPLPHGNYSQRKSVYLPGVVSTDSNSAALSSSLEGEASTEYNHETSTVESSAAASDGARIDNTQCSVQYPPEPAYRADEHCGAESQMAEHVTNRSYVVPTAEPPSANPPVNTSLSMELTGEYFDEEEKVNALVLEKVFAKVPNMPKNLSRRLVAKFKEYAKHRGVKITTDSKVIDEFVSKIYYKGSASDRAANRPQSAQDTPEAQSSGPPQEATPLAAAESNTRLISSGMTGPLKTDASNESPKVDDDHKETADIQNNVLQTSSARDLPTVADSSCVEETSAPEVVATHVILAERTLYFSPTFASMAMKSTQVLEKLHLVNDVGQKRGENNGLTDVGQEGEETNDLSDIGQRRGENNELTNMGQKKVENNELTNVGQKRGENNELTNMGQKRGENNELTNMGQKRGKSHGLTTAKCIDTRCRSVMTSDVTTVPNRRNSVGDRLLPKSSTTLRRSGSLSQLASYTLKSDKGFQLSQDYVGEDLEVSPSSTNTAITAVVTESSENIPSEVVGENPALNVTDAAAVCEEKYPDVCTDKLKVEEVEVSFPPVSQSETAPILISSSVADIVSGHPGLEVDIAGKPLKQELLDEDIKDSSIDKNTKPDKPADLDGQKTPEKGHMFEKMFEKVTGKSSSILDKTTGKLVFKKTKRGRPRKLFIENEDKQEEESKNLEPEEEHFVRRSSRSRKPVNKNYQSDANEIDELMSDDDDEYLIDEDDYDTDTDGDWRGGDSEQPPKKRIKKVVPPPDPTAFDISTKGKFKCWLCKKMFSRCTFAKSHLIQKHKEGLCAVYMDKSEDSKTLCLLVFCPRKCKYVTLNLEGLMAHMETCAGPTLEADGKPYLEIHKHFLDTKYKELQAMSLESVLNTIKARKPKDPAKVKKSRLNMGKSPSTPVVIRHSDATVTIKADGAAASPVVASMLSSSALVAATSAVVSHTGASLHFNTSTHGQGQTPAKSEHSLPITSSKHFFHHPQHPTRISSPQLSHPLPASAVPEMSGSHLHHVVSGLATAPARPVANKTLIRQQQQVFGSCEPAKPGKPFSPPLPAKVSETSIVMEPEDDDDMYMVEDNGTIYLQ